MSLPILNIQPGDAPFTENPAESYTLPARFYTDPDIYAAEKEAIFYQTWNYVGHASQLKDTGQYLTSKIHDQNIFAIRDKQNELKAYYNVCQHRGHELLNGTGKTKLIVCPYHAWSYDTNGNLKAARNSENVQGFNPCDFSLKSIQVEQFCGMVFINLDPNATPLKDQVPELEQEIRTYCPNVDQLQAVQRDTYQAKCNWKVMIDNFLECYHCQPAHKDFVDLVDMPSYRSKTNGIYSSHISKQIRSTNNNAFKIETGKTDFGYAGWFLWPNLTLWIYPGDANLSILQMIPHGTEQTLEYQDWFIPESIPSPQLKEAMDYQKDILQPEDISLCESVQNGLNSKGYNQGRFIVDKDKTELSEHAVHHFQAMVAKALRAELE